MAATKNIVDISGNSLHKYLIYESNPIFSWASNQSRLKFKMTVAYHHFHSQLIKWYHLINFERYHFHSRPTYIFKIGKMSRHCHVQFIQWGLADSGYYGYMQI